MLFATTVWVVIDEKSFTCNGHRKHILAGPLNRILKSGLNQENFRVIKNARGISTVKGQGIALRDQGLGEKLYKITNYLFIS
jgi:hypothetical protein